MGAKVAGANVANLTIYAEATSAVTGLWTSHLGPRFVLHENQAKPGDIHAKCRLNRPEYAD